MRNSRERERLKWNENARTKNILEVGGIKDEVLTSVEGLVHPKWQFFIIYSLSCCEWGIKHLRFKSDWKAPLKNHDWTVNELFCQLDQPIDCKDPIQIHA